MPVRVLFAAAVLAIAAAFACQHAEGPVPGGGPVIVENADGGVIFPSTDAAVRDDGGLDLDAGLPGMDGGVILSFDAG